ncbi:hypothetical protein [Actinophytocola sediminis]
MDAEFEAVDRPEPTAASTDTDSTEVTAPASTDTADHDSAAKPADSAPDESELDDSEPDDAEPDDVEPTDAEPVDSGVADTADADAPADAGAVSAELTDVEPADADTAEPGDSEPGEATDVEPDAAESSAAGPVDEAPVVQAVPTRGSRPRNDTDGPELPNDIQFSDLDQEARRELRSLAKSVAELVGRHLVAAGQLIDEDPERALEHARFARSRAARVAIVREAAGITAYHAGEWAEALGELRAVRRMTGDSAHLPVMADCERALGRPERALDLAAEAAPNLPPDVTVELRIVAAGARRDMGQVDAAVVALQGPDLDPARRDPWSVRLFYAYADNLQAAGRTEEAIRWFLNAAEADHDEETDAAERAVELGAP